MDFSENITDADFTNKTNCTSDDGALSSSLVTTVSINLVVCAFGVIGNVLCVVVLFNKRMSRSSYTYLLQGLTISDTLLLLRGLVENLKELEVISVSNDVYTTAVIFFWDHISALGTNYFIVAISFERLFVISFPLKAHSILTPGRSRRTACGIFCAIVLVTCTSYAYQMFVDNGKSYQLVVATLFMMTPFLLVVLLNALILIQLAKIRNLAIRRDSTAKNDVDYYVTRMLLAVIFVFGISSFFDVTRQVMIYMWPEYVDPCKYYDYAINSVTDTLDHVNSSVNFILYSLLDRKFRAVFCKIFRIRQNSKSNENSKGLATISSVSTTSSLAI